MKLAFVSKVKLALIIALIILLLFVRAWPRIINPQVWSEDGSHNLFGYINNGFLSIFDPVNGYMILVPKIITAISSIISIVEYPLISSTLAWILIVTVLTIIATAPLRLRGGVLLAVACLWIPSDPEVYGLPLYTFWWTSLLLFSIVFWDELQEKWRFRALIVVLASLSAPVILIILPIFWSRAYAFRNNPAHLKLAIIASICAAIQLWVMVNYSVGGTVARTIDLISFIQIIPKFMGSYAVGNLLHGFEWFAGIALAILLAVATWRARTSWLMWALAYLWIAATLISISRVDINIIHPKFAGPRYFFFPFVLMSWWLLQIILTDRSMWLRCGVSAIMLLAAINVLPVIDRNHDNLHWRNHLKSCSHFESYAIPVHTNGDSALAWHLSLSGEQCLKLISTDPLLNQKSFNRIVTYPYRVIREKTDIAEAKLIDVTSVFENEWLGMDYHSHLIRETTLSGYKVIGSFNGSNNFSGILRLTMSRGDQIWYRSEPRSKNQFIEIENHRSDFMTLLPSTSDWVLLEFSNTNLPEKFIVKFIDGGDGWGEWSSVGLKVE